MSKTKPTPTIQETFGTAEEALEEVRKIIDACFSYEKVMLEIILRNECADDFLYDYYLENKSFSTEDYKIIKSILNIKNVSAALEENYIQYGKKICLYYLQKVTPPLLFCKLYRRTSFLIADLIKSI